MTIVALALGNETRRISPDPRPESSASSRSACSSRQIAASAWETSSSPASVRTGPLRSRTSSCTPASASSAAICWLIADWDTYRESAAPENEPWVATSLEAPAAASDRA